MKLVPLYSTIKMMQGPINIRLILILELNTLLHKHTF